MELLIKLVVVALLFLIGLVFGRLAEKRHFRQLARDEAELRDIMLFSEKTVPDQLQAGDARLVSGAVVLGEDYFKRVAATLKSLVGGRLGVYESLMDRGRREAIVRLKRAARAQGANIVFNVRLETASLSEDMSGRGTMFSAEFLAYGTAMRARL